MLVIIHPAQNEVLVDGAARTVDCSAFLASVISVEFDTTRATGAIQFASGSEPLGLGKFNRLFGQYLQAWKAAGFTDPRTLAERRAGLVEEVKGYRNQRSQMGGYLVSGKWFHSDQSSRTQQMALVMLGASVPSGLQWKTMDGSFVTMTPTLAGAVFQAAVAKDVATFAAAEAHIAAINASSTPELYDYKSSGWPAIFGE